MNPLIQLKKAAPVFLVALVLACFALPQRVQATDLGSVLPGGNTADGFGVLTSLTTGGFNTGTGWFSLKTVSSGSFNTAFGAATLFANTGTQNTAVGAAALFSNTTGSNNTSNGVFALLNNTTGNNNTATGDVALSSNTTGAANTATGFQALLSNTTGRFNTANGGAALAANTIGISNTAIGVQALFSTTGDDNTATGYQALFNNTTDGNTANGYQALFNNTTGFANTALGVLAGSNVTTAANVICIGSGVAGANVDNTCFIGNIRGVTTINANAIPVLIDSAGQLGTASSSRRFKKEIKPMDNASEAILALKPVTFHYKTDKTNTPQFGLIAEEVAEVNPDLVVHNADGEIYTVRYDAVNAMLLNEFLKEHRRVQEQEATIAQLKKDFRATVAQLTTRLDEQAAQIQKVSAQVEMSRPAPQTVLNNQ